MVRFALNSLNWNLLMIEGLDMKFEGHDSMEEGFDID